MTRFTRCAGLALALTTVAPVVQADQSVMILGKSTFAARCAVCHGANAKGDGDIAPLFQVPPPDLTKLSDRAGGAFPFSEVYATIAQGKAERAHGASEMPIWGDYFIADTLEDRGISAEDAAHITQGRILSLVYYLEQIQE